jgi:hypothetical protein
LEIASTRSMQTENLCVIFIAVGTLKISVLLCEYYSFQGRQIVLTIRLTDCGFLSREKSHSITERSVSVPHGYYVNEIRHIVCILLQSQLRNALVKSKYGSLTLNGVQNVNGRETPLCRYISSMTMIFLIAHL